MSSIQRTRHSVYDLKYHFVWVPKYRKLILQGKLALRLRELFVEISQRYGWELEEAAVVGDHVHLFVSAPPKYAPARIVQIYKSISARLIFQEFPEVKKHLWGGELWSDGYFVRSVGDQVTAQVIKRYVRAQHDPSLPFDL
ncbi:IS200/IS605 family transposase [Candidatus Acetothermia bacterium]|nr:IS200/IS605 family transposase [Candidatus Acetothermia bacterium]